MKCVTAALAAIVLCCTAASAHAADALACKPGRESALADGRVTIRPGETLCVRLRAGDRQVAAEAVVSAADAAGALVVELSEQGGNTMLTLKNPLGGTLRYRARLASPARPEGMSTSTCPVMAHLTNFETWPGSVGAIVLSDFELLPEGGKVVCQ